MSTPQMMLTALALVLVGVFLGGGLLAHFVWNRPGLTTLAFR